MIMSLIKQSKNVLQAIFPCTAPFEVQLSLLCADFNVLHTIYACKLLLSRICTDKESTAAREQLEKDLHTTRLELQEKSKDNVPGDYSTSGSLTDKKITSETEVSTAQQDY